MAPATIAIAMSGGVDSSVAAARLVQQGHSVFGLMLRLWSPDGGPPNRCCSPSDMAAARRVAGSLGIPFYAIDVQDRFRRQVVDFFVEGYRSGVTPNPCLVCNRDIRWSFLLDHALALGATHLATGHYARVRERGGEFLLSRAVDRDKDQSYVLSLLGQNQLARAVFPLGELTKDEVRSLARRIGLEVAERPESQDLCFLGGEDYREFLRPRLAPTPGPILNEQDEEIGQHQGLFQYTIGQRKGLGLARGEATYVVAKDLTHNALRVGKRQDLARTSFFTAAPHWIGSADPALPRRAGVQVRYHAREAHAELRPRSNTGLEVHTQEPLFGVTPGQAAAFYEGEDCVGVGIIEA